MFHVKHIKSTILCPVDSCDGEWEFEGSVQPAEPDVGIPNGYVEWDVSSGHQVTDHTCGLMVIGRGLFEDALNVAEDEFFTETRKDYGGTR